MNTGMNTLKHFEQVDKIVPKVYYHYTSLDALFSIITSKTFRLTSLRSSNDKKELSYSFDKFVKTFLDLCKYESDPEKKEILHKFKRGMDENPDTFKKLCKNDSKPFALCLSKKKDNLTHWDRYAVNCKGVCIGINAAALNVHCQRTAALAFASDLIEVGSVIYQQKEIEDRILTETLKAYKIICEAATKITSEDPETVVEDRGYYFLSSIYSNLARFVKNPSFIDEDEIRMYFDANSIAQTLQLFDSLNSDSPDMSTLVEDSRESYLEVVKDFGVEKENFMVTRAGIRSYRDLRLDKIWGPGTIVLGPMCVQNKNKLKAFLKANGLQGTQVSVSKVPIR